MVQIYALYKTVLFLKVSLELTSKNTKHEISYPVPNLTKCLDNVPDMQLLENFNVSQAQQT